MDIPHQASTRESLMSDESCGLREPEEGWGRGQDLRHIGCPTAGTVIPFLAGPRKQPLCFALWPCTSDGLEGKTSAWLCRRWGEVLERVRLPFTNHIYIYNMILCRYMPICKQLLFPKATRTKQKHLLSHVESRRTQGCSSAALSAPRRVLFFWAQSDGV